MKARIQKITPAPQESFRYFLKQARSFPFNWHFHPEYELTLILRSRGERFVGDDIAEYADGDLVLIGPNLPHTWRSTRTTGQHTAVVVQFRENFLGAEFFQKPELQAIARLFHRARRGLMFRGAPRRRAAEIIRRMQSRSGLGRLLALLDALGLLARAPARPLASAGFQPEATREDERRITQICEFIDQHTEQRLTLPAVAQLVHMSPASLSRFFKRTTGKTFNRYLNELRIGQACRQLIESDRTVAEICFSCGFNNLANFNRRFRQFKRLSPREYRQSFSAPLSAPR